MADVKDILGVPRGAAPVEARKPEKKERMKRPEGMSREAFALLGGGSNPIIPRHMLDGLKKKDAKPKPSHRGTVTYQWKVFKNQARKDGLELKHWVKGYKDATGRIRDAHEGDYLFAKYNKKLVVYRYDDEEYTTLIAPGSGDWTREETDYLLDLCQLLDLRFVVIIDRYDFPGGPERTMEDLKDRYYSIARKLLVAREGGDAPVANHPLLRVPYNGAQERARKSALKALMERDPAHEERDNQILDQARQIEERRKAEAAAQAAAAAAAAAQQRKAAAAQTAAAAGRPMPMPEGPINPEDLVYPPDFPNLPPGPPGASPPSLVSATLEPVRPPPGVYARSLHMADQVEAQQSILPGASRVAGALDKALIDLRVTHLPRVFTRSTTGQYLALRGELVHMLELKRQLAVRADGKRDKRKKADDVPLRTEKRQRVAKRYD